MFRTRDMAQARDYLSELFRPHRLLPADRRPALAFEHSHAGFKDVTFNHVRYGCAMTIAAPPVSGDYLVKFTLAGVGRVTQGRNSFDTRKGMVCILNPSQSLNVAMSADYHHLTIRLDGAALQNHLARELDHAVADPLAFAPLPLDLTGQGARLARFAKTALEMVRDDATTPATWRFHRQIEQALMSLILADVPHNYSQALARPPAMPSPYYVKKARDYIHAHPRAAITLQDLVEQTGVSARSLQSGFRACLGLSPMAYVRQYKLALARRALARAAPGQESVTDIALDLGFAHLSKFAQAYKQSFGELPSQTLRRSKN